MLMAYKMKFDNPQPEFFVKIGDIITSFRGEKAKLLACERMNEFRYGGRRSGKVFVEWISDGFRATYYDNVFGLTVIDSEFELMYTRE